MIENRTERLGVLFLLALVLLLPVLTHADTVERSFDAAGLTLLQVETDVGAITINTHNANSIDVRVMRSGPLEDELQIRFETDSNRLSVYGELPDRYRRNWSGRSRANFEITVPRQFDIDVKTSGGSIEISDINGEIEAYTAGGSLSFGEVNGRLSGRTSGGSIEFKGGNADTELHTSGGSIKVGDVGGAVEVDTSGGSISIGRVSGSVSAHTSGGSISIEDAMGNVDARTSGGSVTANLSGQPTGDSRLETSGGTVTVYLADHLALDINATAGWGKVKSDFDLGREPGDFDRGRHLRGKLNGGGPRLDITSSNGARIRRQ